MKLRSEIEEQYKWNLKDIYETEEDFFELYEFVNEAKFEKYQNGEDYCYGKEILVFIISLMPILEYSRRRCNMFRRAIHRAKMD